MTAPLASRRALLCGIGALPVLGTAAAARPGANPTLARLVARYERAHRLLDRTYDHVGRPPRHLYRIAGRLRYRIAHVRAESLDDIMLKVRAMLASYSVEDWAWETFADVDREHAYITTVSESITLDLMRMVEARQCA